ncbi:replication initiation protein [Francisella philomiragia]|uniref:Initiator Replication family protein n=1 Tax=Francisella philomiragia TaxID=28110 RepID=A0AAW3DCM5_9GAMM|nr:replication initiation protein [Francisella philomiragia]KFJ43114.1 initiator Replication family protein [Francisella philomiragia]MBK2255716.1 replication initiation protein [Francisella philomiragia]MBK2274031.1 replication initiation protein [Francisella philomiragia]MBK2277871.1 replication initiation protein [Francisella philomiragia]MBK2281816.1 replication initiation protein [Francisella philomiragia]
MQIKQRDNLKLSNTFIEAKCDKMNKDEQNFLYLCISQVNADDSYFSPMKIHLKDIQELALVKKNHVQVRNFIAKLSRKGVNIQNGKTFMPRVFFQKLNYIEGTGYIEAQLHEDLQDLCLELKRNFTQASLQACISFRSKYSSPLYLLLKSVYDKQKQYQDYIFVDYTVDYLINHFQLPKSYKVYGHLRERFLEVTEKDINDNSDFTISFEPIKRGRSLEGIRFTVHKKQHVESISLDNFALDFDKSDITMRVTGELDEISQKTIKAFNYDIEEIEKLINDYSKDIVENALFVMSNKDPKVFTNAFGYLKAIIENKAKN